MTPNRLISLCLFTCMCIAASSGNVRDDDWRLLPLSESQRTRVLGMSPLPLPPADPTNRVADDPAAARFGQYLFFDTRLSMSNTVSCATCHDPAKSFSNGQQLGEGLGRTSRHVPTLLNVAHHRWFYWDGSADTLWAQALRPIEHESEMGFDRTGVARLIVSDDALRASYEGIFGPLPPALHDLAGLPSAARPISDKPDDPRQAVWASMSEPQREAINRVFSNVGKALAAYQRRLQPSGSPFDEFVAGLRAQDVRRQRQLSVAAQRGLQLFIGDANCHLCHSGPLLSDRNFHNVGVRPLDDAGWHDAGRFNGVAEVRADPFNARGAYSDAPEEQIARRLQTLVATPEVWGAFKTPSLRSVARTAPYMHQGQLATLEDVVRFYATRETAVQIGHHQDPLLQPLNLSDRQIADLVAFLEALTAPELPDSLLKPPTSPQAD